MASITNKPKEGCLGNVIQVIFRRKTKQNRTKRIVAVVKEQRHLNTPTPSHKPACTACCSTSSEAGSNLVNTVTSLRSHVGPLRAGCSTSQQGDIGCIPPLIFPGFSQLFSIRTETKLIYQIKCIQKFLFPLYPMEKKYLKQCPEIQIQIHCRF